MWWGGFLVPIFDFIYWTIVIFKRFWTIIYFERDVDSFDQFEKIFLGGVGITDVDIPVFLKALSFLMSLQSRYLYKHFGCINFSDNSIGVEGLKQILRFFENTSVSVIYLDRTFVSYQDVFNITKSIKFKRSFNIVKKYYGYCANFNISTNPPKLTILYDSPGISKIPKCLISGPLNEGLKGIECLSFDGGHRYISVKFQLCHLDAFDISTLKRLFIDEIRFSYDKMKQLLVRLKACTQLPL